MPSAEKALLKQAIAEDIANYLENQVSAEKRVITTTKGGVAALDTAIQRLMGMHTLLDKELDEGEIDKDDYKLVKKWIAKDLNELTNMSRTFRASIPTAGGRVEGIVKSISLVRDYARRAGVAVEQAKVQDEEEEEYQRDLEERQQDNGNAPETPAEDDTGAFATTDTMTPEGEEETYEFPEYTTDLPVCVHCGLPIETDSGDPGHCVPCVSYKNRYEKLPPVHVLKARRARWEEARES